MRAAARVEHVTSFPDQVREVRCIPKTGRLSHDDLEKYIEAVGAVEAANKKYSAQKKH